MNAVVQMGTRADTVKATPSRVWITLASTGARVYPRMMAPATGASVPAPTRASTVSRRRTSVTSVPVFMVRAVKT